MDRLKRLLQVPVLAKGETSAGFLLIVAFSMLAMLFAVYGRGISHTAIFLNDTFVFFDGIHRIANGQTPNVDFFSPVGPLPYLLPYVGFRITGGYAGAVEMASLLLAAAALPVGAFLLWKRTAPAMALLILGVIASVIVVPLVPGQGAEQISHAMHYNRWSWGLLLIVFLLGLPAKESLRWVICAGLLGGVTLTVIFYMKITYFLVGLVFLLLLLLFPDLRRRTGVFALLASAVTLATTSAIFPEIVSGYIASIAEALAVDDAVRGSYSAIAMDNRISLGFMALALYAALLRSGVQIRELVLVGFIIVSGLAIIDQNFQWTFIVTLPAAFAILAAKRAREPGAAGQVRSLIIAGAYLMVLPYATDWARVTLRYALPLSVEATTLEGADFERMYVYDRDGAPARRAVDNTGPVDFAAFLRGETPTALVYETEYAEVQNDGARLLISAGVSDAEILTLDFANTMPLMVDAPRQSKGYSWLHFGRNVSEATIPDGAAMFEGIEFLMVPRATITPVSVDRFRAIYGEYLARTTTEVAQSEYWVLLKHDPAASN